MKLTSENVDRIFRDCLMKDDDPRMAELEGITSPEQFPDWLVPADGLTLRTGLVREKVQEHREDIREMLSELPDSFHASGGGGMSFLNMCDDKEGNQWTGLHATAEQLVVLGIATGFAKYALPREMWGALPGGMPYIIVNLESENG